MPHILNGAWKMTSGLPVRVFVSMPRFLPRSIVLVAALCILWQGIGAGISTAQAGCGDYVHLGTMESPARLSGIADTVSGFDSTVPNPEFPRQPCQGPHCGEQPSTPPSPAPGPTSGSPQHEAYLVELLAIMSHASDFVSSDTTAQYGKLPEAPLEPPPRLCS
jgi:hypothetical protein